MPKVTIYHNPRCSKSRQTLELIRENGIEPDVIEYLKTPPSATELKHILKLLDLAPRELLRKNESEYQVAGLDAEDLGDSEIIDAMVSHPRLIERPIVVRDGKAVIGRPPENVKKIL
jgi:arsenate reductase